MKVTADKAPMTQGRSGANPVSKKTVDAAPASQFTDNSPQGIQLRKVQEMANNSAQVKRLIAFQDMADKSVQIKGNALQLKKRRNTVNPHRKAKWVRIADFEQAMKAGTELQDFSLVNGVKTAAFNLDEIASPADDPWEGETISEELLSKKGEQDQRSSKAALNLTARITRLRKLYATNDPAIPAEMRKRAKTMIDTYARLKNDGWNEEYINEFLKMQHKMDEAGVFKDLSPELVPGNSVTPDKTGGEELPSTTLVTPKGKQFGNIRGAGGVAHRFYNFLDANGGDRKHIQEFAAAQLGSSWSAASRMAKLFTTSMRETPVDQYYWHPNDDYRRQYQELNAAEIHIAGEENPYRALNFEADYQRTMIAQHAFTYELLNRMKLPNTDQGKRIARLKRLEREGVINDLAERPVKGMPIKGLKTGPAESYSLLEPYKDPKVKPLAQEGFYTTRQEMPFHRIFATYMQPSPNDLNKTMLYGDGENEFISMGEGVTSTFHEKDDD